jgi:hypothetical protein
MRLLNYIFWGCGYLYLALEVSFWFLLLLPIIPILWVLCDDWLYRKGF